jgi:hypothetical protein
MGGSLSPPGSRASTGVSAAGKVPKKFRPACNAAKKTRLFTMTHINAHLL